MPRDQEQALPSRGPRATARVGTVTPAPCQALCQEARMTSWICLSSSAWAAGRSSPIGKPTPTSWPLFLVSLYTQVFLG